MLKKNPTSLAGKCSSQRATLEKRDFAFVWDSVWVAFLGQRASARLNQRQEPRLRCLHRDRCSSPSPADFDRKRRLGLMWRLSVTALAQTHLCRRWAYYNATQWERTIIEINKKRRQTTSLKKQNTEVGFKIFCILHISQLLVTNSELQCRGSGILCIVGFSSRRCRELEKQHFLFCLAKHETPSLCFGNRK